MDPCWQTTYTLGQPLNAVQPSTSTPSAASQLTFVTQRLLFSPSTSGQIIADTSHYLRTSQFTALPSSTRPYGPPSLLLPSHVQVSSLRPPLEPFRVSFVKSYTNRGCSKKPLQKTARSAPPPKSKATSPKPVVFLPSPPVHIDAQKHVLSFAVPCQGQNNPRKKTLVTYRPWPP